MHEMEMRLLDLFSGIGGFSYAAEKLVGGYKTVAFCEMDEFCQKVLQKHWPEIPIYDDVRTLDATRLGRIDIVTGGYPCQPFSQAGKRQGEKDERHLWPEMLRIIKSCKPRYVLAENVAGHVNMGLDQVLTDLEDQGYTTRPIIIPACAKNAPHRRDRVWIIGELMADTKNIRWEQTEWQGWESSRRGSQDINGSETEREETNRSDVADTTSKGKWKITKGLGESQKEMGEKRSEFTTRSDTSSTETATNVANSESISRNVNGIVRKHGQTKTQEISRNRDGLRNTQKQQSNRSTNKATKQRMGDLVNGISKGLLEHFNREPEDIPRVTSGEKDRAKKLMALGNSIVPQVAAEIFNAIKVAEHGKQ
ncbi:MAG TPA: hypothetical protein DCM40_29170 [Maribacter sp.]|nr:hypothetical protein [Maribacter sp.]